MDGTEGVTVLIDASSSNHEADRGALDVRSGRHVGWLAVRVTVASTAQVPQTDSGNDVARTSQVAPTKAPLAERERMDLIFQYLVAPQEGE